jgi:hypothetical protein
MEPPGYDESHFDSLLITVEEKAIDRGRSPGSIVALGLLRDSGKLAKTAPR